MERKKKVRQGNVMWSRFKADFGQPILANPFFLCCCGWFWCGKVFCVVVFLCCCVLCVCMWWVCSGPLRRPPLRRTAQNFALSYPSPASEPRRPVWWGRRGLTRQPENSKRAHLSAPALQTPPKFHEKDQKRGKNNEKTGARGKKARNFWPPPWGATLRAPPFGAPTFSGFGPPPLAAPQ